MAEPTSPATTEDRKFVNRAIEAAVRIGVLAVLLLWCFALVLTMVCIVLGVLQLGVGLVVIPVVVYLFSTADTFTAVAFLVYAIVILPLDNILKPLLLGRGVRVPMAVVFIGAIGGFFRHGLVGLFVGAVIFTLGYGLLLAWLKSGDAQAADAAP